MIQISSTENSKEPSSWLSMALTEPTKFIRSSGIWTQKNISSITEMRKPELIWLITSKLLTASKSTQSTNLCLKLDKRGKIFTCHQSSAHSLESQLKLEKTREWWLTSDRVSSRSLQKESEVSKSLTEWSLNLKKFKNGILTSMLSQIPLRQEFWKDQSFFQVPNNNPRARINNTTWCKMFNLILVLLTTQRS